VIAGVVSWHLRTSEAGTFVYVHVFTTATRTFETTLLHIGTAEVPSNPVSAMKILTLKIYEISTIFIEILQFIGQPEEFNSL
jgi:hypothetical protein